MNATTEGVVTRSKRVGDSGWLAASDDGDDRLSGPEVDADRTSQRVTSGVHLDVNVCKAVKIALNGFCAGAQALSVIVLRPGRSAL